MRPEPLISVIVPVYKVESYLDRCVRSIVEQSYTNLEIILVDDGSPDNCPGICDDWAGKDSRVRVIHKENGGLSDARNAGIRAAAGEYISFIDSDDRIAPEMLEKLYAALERDESDIAACTVEMVWENGMPPRFLTVQTNCLLGRQEAQLALLRETTLKHPVWYKLYRRETVEGLLFDKGKYHEDVFWSYQAVGRARRVSVIDYVGYYYVQRGDSIMGAGYSLKRLDAVEAYERRARYMEAYFPELEREARLKVLTGCIYHGQMALKYLPEKECRQALAYLEAVKKRNPVLHHDYAQQKLTRRAWLEMARLSLKSACRLRNALGIGL